MNEAISLIREIYGIEALEDSIVSVYPNFRPKRASELKVLYDVASVGLGGKRSPQWPGFSRQDKKPVKILPFRFAFSLTEEGIYTVFENGGIKLTDKSYEALLRFHIDNEDKLNPLYFSSNIYPVVGWDDTLPLLSPIKEHYEFRIKHKLFDNHFVGHSYHFPVSKLQLMEMVANFAHFFPVYDSYTQIAKGLPPRLDRLITNLNDWLQKAWDEESANNESGQPKQGSDVARQLAGLAAESRTPPGRQSSRPRPCRTSHRGEPPCRLARRVDATGAATVPSAHRGLPVAGSADSSRSSRAWSESLRVLRLDSSNHRLPLMVC
ncbi:MAG: hypothetical protein IPJ52_01975 [Rhodocyclaceae bacterium]|nr:hypothetical protein [Rhodocyclaceae bacterium]